MSFGLGQLAGLGPDDITQLLQRIQAYGAMQQDPNASGPQAGTQGQPPAIAGTEAEVQRLERQQASPQDAAALGGSPVDRLLYGRAGMGGGPGGFLGSADPLGSRNVPMPPARPSDEALSAQPATTGTVSGANPDASAGPQRRVVASTSYHPDLASDNPTGGRPAAAADYRGGPGDFDPLTGRLLGGSQPAAPSQAGASAGAPAAQGAGAPGGPQQSILERFAQGLNHPDVSNLLLSIGTGLLTNRGIPQGIGAGLQSFQQSRLGDVKTQLQLYQLQQQAQQLSQQQNATRQYLRGKGLSADQVEAATLNPAILSSLQSQMNKDPSQITFGGNTYLVPPGGRPDQSNLLGPSGIPLEQEVKKADALAAVKDAHEKDDIVLQSDGQGGTIAVRKSSLFPDKASAGAAGEGGAPAAAGTDPNIRTIVPPQPDKKANEGLDKLIGDNITGGYQKAQGAVGTLAAISRQKEALDNHVISGSGADWRTQAQAIGAQLLGIDPSQLNASYSFDAASTQKQAELAKAVSQAGHTTNMDLQLGKTIAGGDRSKTEQALRQIVDAQETLARDAIDRHNAALDKYAKIAPEAAARTGFFRVDTPEVYRYGQGTPNPVADPGTRMPTGAPTPLDVGGSRQFQGITIKRVR
jgi:hypothetical protein